MKNNFRVIKIIDDTSLIINGGMEDGVKLEDVMEIHGTSEDIFDSKTNENLGKIDVIKDSLKVKKVYEKMCIYETNYESPYITSALKNFIFFITPKEV